MKVLDLLQRNMSEASALFQSYSFKLLMMFSELHTVDWLLYWFYWTSVLPLTLFQILGQVIFIDSVLLMTFPLHVLGLLMEAHKVLDLDQSCSVGP